MDTQRNFEIVLAGNIKRILFDSMLDVQCSMFDVHPFFGVVSEILKKTGCHEIT
jgi:hypothetical protein